MRCPSPKIEADKVVKEKRVVDLENACRLWMAVSAAKDERIQILEAECNQLRNRVARLLRQINRKCKAEKTENGHLEPLTRLASSQVPCRATDKE
jgi:hypothetical protein